MKKITYSALLFLLIISGCASFKEQSLYESSDNPYKKITNSVYLFGNYGQKNVEKEFPEKLSKIIKEASPKSTLLFLGDNISIKKDSISDQNLLQEQLDFAKKNKGKTYFIPGENEWKYANNDKNQNVQEYLKKESENSKIFQPKNGCPISTTSIDENLEVIFIDSQWFIADWDKIEKINEYCSDINTRRRFAEELESEIKNAEFKNIILAIHHPIFNNGKFLSKNSFNKRYTEFISLIASLSKLSDRITIVSAHESNLQYLTGGGIHQVISGSLTEKKKTKLSKESITALGGRLNFKGIYANSENGYAKLNYYEDGSSSVEFYNLNNIFLYRTILMKPLPLIIPVEKNKILAQFPSTFKAKILSEEETSKSWTYKKLWGEHYRSYYSKEITAKTVILDTLFGGLEIVKEGGGHQSNSLRLKTKDGRQYAMRSLQKNAMKFLSFKMKGIAFDADSYKETAAENIVADFFTTAHPYAQLAVKDMAKAAKINHSNTRLFYVPQQQTFGDLNEKYGNGLYFIEERPSKEQKNFEGYQFAYESKDIEISDFIGTTEVLEKLRSNNNYKIDERQYIRSRIFDMLLGDWDRHEDQWRWAFRKTGNKAGVYAPIPRDRDAAFSKFDGISLNAIKLFAPETRFWQTYDEELCDVKWFNSEAYNLDKILLASLPESVWKEEALSIQLSLNEEKIDNAFKNLPSEVQDEKLLDIKNKLKGRLKNLDGIAEKYSEFLTKKIVITASDSKDKIVISNVEKGITKVEVFSMEDNKQKLHFSNSFNSKATKEIIIYGLNGDDEYIVEGNQNSQIVIRMVGGYGNDIYDIQKSKKTRVYDYEYEKNNFVSKKPGAKQLSSIYETNNLHYRFFIPNNNILLPAIGFATDDGLYFGIKDIYTNNGFNGNPHKQVHQLYANYYFTFQSLEAGYKGVFSNIFPKIDLFAEAYFSGAKFSNNFFGYGNETENNDDELGKDYNRARTRQISFKTGLSYKNLKVSGIYEGFEVEQMQDRFFTEANLGNGIFKNQNYLGGEISYAFANSDALDFPTRGIYFEATGGWKINTEEHQNNFGYAIAKVGFDQKINASGTFVFQTNLAGKTIISDDYYFYHSSFLGGNNGLRGYRNERFSGKHSFYDSSNLKLRISRLKTGFLPLDFGVYGGFDVGRVWIEDDNSKKWHTSQGGGIWLGGLNMLSLQSGFFNSDEGNILFVGFNFKY